ncbi:hypothetical protein RJT34_06777 [Clitoria ternatea]|uniref:Uncharacterized protein n=1 Tax=Clitoria ternatea TaxID=43366 RepID=A0AAN9K4H0_CLITE
MIIQILEFMYFALIQSSYSVCLLASFPLHRYKFLASESDTPWLIIIKERQDSIKLCVSLFISYIEQNGFFFHSGFVGERRWNYGC